MYEVVWCKGDYPVRQAQANAAKCVCYVEQHFNAKLNDDPDTQKDNPALCIVSANASVTSRNWASFYVKAIAAEFGVGMAGVSVGPARGDANLRYTKMPAILLEPLFCSDPQQAALIRSAAGQRRLARVLVDSIRRFFPDGGKVGFSVGHKYKLASPYDRGAALHGGGITEAECAEQVLLLAETLLETAAPLPTVRELRIVRGGQQIYTLELSEDALLSLQPGSDLLTISE